MRIPRTLGKPVIYPTIPLAECLAKTTEQECQPGPGQTVETHSRIVGRVAEEIIGRYPEQLRRALFIDEAGLIAALHDIGKISPGFQDRIYRALKQDRQISQDPDLDRKCGFHANVSSAALSDTSKDAALIVGRHHGSSHTKLLHATDEIVGGEEWQQLRQTLLQRLCEYFSMSLPSSIAERHIDVLSGLTSVSDWIGSAACSSLSEPLSEDIQQDIKKAVDDAGFIPFSVRSSLRFSDIFPFEARDIQKQFYENIEGPGVYVLEAPTGSGKTEAALYVAYRMLEQQKATGIYFALPTQLTSDKVYERMNLFLQNILQEDSSHRSPHLLHAAAWLRKTVMGEAGSPGGEWFRSNKRRILAPFAVGTIDQALMAVMNVRHGFVRSFGLAGKVVILDEVHSYDSYTGTILDALVSATKELQCTVLILSATLTSERRGKILSVESETEDPVHEYPCVTLVSQDATEGIRYIAPSFLDERDISLTMQHDDNNALHAAVTRACSGEQVLWIENTVRDAQHSYRQIAKHVQSMDVDTGLIHSRFIKKDRREREGYWTALFGKDGREKRRERGRILVGTQVLEQSLDIDADFLVSRLCPSDMLLQRMGRLWRHRENDALRAETASPSMCILAPDLETAHREKEPFGRSKWVYASYVLFRTLEVWSRYTRIRQPKQVREILDATYCEREESGRMKDELRTLKEGINTMARFARTSISTGGLTYPDSSASTRYTEIETVDLLLFAGHPRTVDNVIEISLHDGSTWHWETGMKYSDPQKWRKLAVALHDNTVVVPKNEAPPYHGKLTWLRDFFFLGNNTDSCPISVAIVGEDKNLRSSDNTVTDLYYTENMGFEKRKH